MHPPSKVTLSEVASNYEDAVKRAIMLGNDTDTTACVTGGLAGIAFGFDNIPQRWYKKLRGKDTQFHILLERVLNNENYR